MLEALCLKKYHARVEWIDIARGLSMMVILYAHVFDDGLITRFVHLFHVPVFFLLSGVVWKQADKIKDFFVSILKGLVIPYFFAGTVSIFVYQILGSFFPKGNLGLAECIQGLFYANSRTGLMVWCRPLWFLPCLVLVRILWELISHVKKIVFRYVIVLIIWVFAVVSLYTSLKGLRLPWEFEVALHALPFFCMGVIFKQNFMAAIDEKRKKTCLILAFLICFLVCILIFHLNDAILSFQYNNYGVYPLFVIGAISGSGMIFSVSMLVARCKWIEIIGQNTLTILLWHKYPILLFQLIEFGKNCCSNPDKISSIIVGVVIVFVSMAISLLVGFVFSCINNKIKR